MRSAGVSIRSAEITATTAPDWTRTASRLTTAPGYDAALATLDLVIPCLQEGKTAEVRALAEEIKSVFRAQDVAREALAAWLLFHRAAVREAVTVELTREVAATLHQARTEA